MVNPQKWGLTFFLKKYNIMNLLNEWTNYLVDSYNFNDKIKEWDVVLPPVMPSTFGVLFSKVENWAIDYSKVDDYINKIIENGGIKRKVFCVVLDTGAKSKSKYLQSNFIDLGLDHTGENQPFDEHSHFSHVLSSIIGEHSSGRMGILKHPQLPQDWFLITGEKVLSKRGVARYDQILEGFKHALEISKPYLNDGYAVVWNCSFGGFGFSQEISSVLVEAEKLGVIIVCAAGNSSGAGVYFPATHQSTIGVGAISSDSIIADFSSRGVDVDLAAPGVDIWGADHTATGTKLSSGSSMASPNQAAMIMLMLAANPDIKNKTQLLDYINANVTDLGTPGEDNDYGKGATIMDKYPILITEKPTKRKKKSEIVPKEEIKEEPKDVVAPKRKFWDIFKKRC